METKCFEIRDDGTLIAVLAIKLVTDSEAENFLLARNGFWGHPVGEEPIIVISLPAMECSYSQYKWKDTSRTMKVAHAHIRENFDALETGAVVDVEFLLGERATPKIAARLAKLEVAEEPAQWDEPVGCPTGCPGCSCHINPPCNHCVENHDGTGELP